MKNNQRKMFCVDVGNMSSHDVMLFIYGFKAGVKYCQS